MDREEKITRIKFPDKENHSILIKTNLFKRLFLKIIIGS